jgi:DNA-binding MarR family transcriptional regulator
MPTPTSTPPHPRAATDRRAADDTPGELIDLVSSLRRAVRRRIRRDWSQQPLTPSEIELLLLVGDRPGLRVQEAALAIGVAANTVSTMVGRLTAGGWIERRPDQNDARAARLALTDAAVQRRAEWRDRRRDMVTRAMDRLDAADRAAIARALPALGRLLAEVEED